MRIENNHKITNKNIIESIENTENFFPINTNPQFEKAVNKLKVSYFCFYYFLYLSNNDPLRSY